MVALNGIPAGESYGSDTSIGGIFWYKRHGTDALMERDRQYFVDVEYCTMLSQEILDDSWFRAALEGSHKRYVEKLEKAVYGSKLFVTEGGSPGLGETPVQPGDSPVFLPGYLHMPFRHSLTRQ